MIVEEYTRSDNNPLPNGDQDPLEPIDLSTTAYKFFCTTEECMMYRLKVPGFPDFHPDEGFGYCKYRVTEESQIEKIKARKRIIVMDEVKYGNNIIYTNIMIIFPSLE